MPEMENPASIDNSGANAADDELLLGTGRNRSGARTTGILSWYQAQLRNSPSRVYAITAGVGVFIIAAMIGVILLAALPRSDNIIVPTTTTAIPTTSTTTTASTTTTSSTTTTPTTTTPTTTTTSSTTTTPTTTTPTTTTTTTSTTTTPTTTASTTTATTTTEKPTTTTANPNSTTTSTTPSSWHPSTMHPMPPDASRLPPVSLMSQLGLNPIWVEWPCQNGNIPVFKFNVTIEGHTYTSDGADKKQEAKKGAAMVANMEMFGIKYDYPIPKPHRPCIEETVEEAEEPTGESPLVLGVEPEQSYTYFTTPPTDSWHPSTLHPMPADASEHPPVSLMYELGLQPIWNEWACENLDRTPVFKFNVTVEGHTFTSEGADIKQEAKKGAAMVANIEMFGINYTYPLPKPHRPCMVSEDIESKEAGVDAASMDENISVTTLPPPWTPTTQHPIPEYPEKISPVDLLYILGLNPVFQLHHCKKTIPPVFKYDVSVQGHTFTSEGGDKKSDAKRGAAMVANMKMFGIKYPFPVPVPQTPCVEDDEPDLPLDGDSTTPQIIDTGNNDAEL